MDDYDVIVIGAGHAGIEAALASSRLGCKTLMLTLNLGTTGLMSCNPAIGGVGKGQLVKEIDALGGEMAKAADACGIQFRILNASKGPAAQSSRAQIDMQMYGQYMQDVLIRQEGLSMREAEAKSLLVEDGLVKAVVTDKGQIQAQAVVICPGTFLDGLIHIGLKSKSAGRQGEPPSIDLARNLKGLGFNLLRFKTGTCPRLDRKTIDFSRLGVQEGDSVPRPFSFSTAEVKQKQLACHITYTNSRTHEIISRNLDRSPLYTGVIKATGVRYCPSIEDKIVKFSGRQRHQVFLEPQGYETDEVYPNGLSTSLPEDAQLAMLRSIDGLERVSVTRFGYGIEHTVVEPTQVLPTLETKLIRNLYLAGQINGTTGYEEAASQGLIAGINAALRIRKDEPFVLDRSSSYIGVLIDDLATKGTGEPYRMFTSRVEYRLLLREDNADIRLRRAGYDIGLVSKEDYQASLRKAAEIKKGIDSLKSARIKPDAGINSKLSGMGIAPIKKAVTLEELLKRPQMDLEKISSLDHVKLAIHRDVLRQVEIEVKYSGFIQRQVAEVARFKNLERIRVPAGLDYTRIPGLSREIQEKLGRFKPQSLGQASRISGVTPAAISILMVYLRKVDAQR